jgi:hypothetical protein
MNTPREYLFHLQSEVTDQLRLSAGMEQKSHVPAGNWTKFIDLSTQTCVGNDVTSSSYRSSFRIDAGKLHQETGIPSRHFEMTFEPPPFWLDNWKH